MTSQELAKALADGSVVVTRGRLVMKPERPTLRGVEEEKPSDHRLAMAGVVIAAFYVLKIVMIAFS